MQPGKDQSGRRSFLARRRACSARIRVARVSRLIGNSVTTANSRDWQVNSPAFWIPAPMGAGPNRGSKSRQTQETPLQTEWRSAVLCRSLASKQSMAGGFSTVPTTDIPDRSVPFEGRFVGGCSCRGLFFFGLVRILPAPSTSLALIK